MYVYYNVKQDRNKIFTYVHVNKPILHKVYCHVVELLVDLIYPSQYDPEVSGYCDKTYELDNGRSAMRQKLKC